MNLDSIDGYIIINGIKYDAKDIIKKLQLQGINIITDNDLLFIGDESIKPSPNQNQNCETCPIISICSIYKDIKEGRIFLKPQSSNSFVSQSLNAQPVKSRKNPTTKSTQQFFSQNYTIPMSDDETVMPVSLENEPVDVPFNFRYSAHHSNQSDKILMKALNPETKYIPRSKNHLSHDPSKTIPPYLQTICPYCNNVVSKEWLYCGHCGRPLRR